MRVTLDFESSHSMPEREVARILYALANSLTLGTSDVVKGNGYTTVSTTVSEGKFTLTLEERPRCSFNSYEDGGRSEKQCDNLAEPEHTCKECGVGWCSEHEDHSTVDEETGLCEDCQ